MNLVSPLATRVAVGVTVGAIMAGGMAHAETRFRIQDFSRNFLGVESTAEAWAALTDIQDMHDISVTTDSVVADGVEALEISGLSIENPAFNDPFTVQTLTINALDVTSISRGQEPHYFDVEAVGMQPIAMDRAALIDRGLPPGLWTQLFGTTAIWVMPAGGNTSLGVSFENEMLGSSYEAIIQGEPAGLSPLEHALVDRVAISFQDRGFLRAAVVGEISHSSAIRDSPVAAALPTLEEVIAGKEIGNGFSLTLSPDRPVRLEEVLLALFDPDMTWIEARGMVGNIDMEATLEIAELIDVNFEAHLQAGSGGGDALASGAIESFSLSIDDQGFVRAFIGAFFAMSHEEMLAVSDTAFDEVMAGAPFPATQDDPRGAVFLALRELIEQSDTGGVFTLTMTPDEPIRNDRLETAVLDPSTASAEALGISVSYTPH